MLVKELYMTRDDGVYLYRTYSNTNKMILQNETNITYFEAIDIENAPFTYTETNIEKENPEWELYGLIDIPIENV
jgi:hypothetical protein